MIKFFTFLWSVVKGLITMVTTLIDSIGMMGDLLVVFGALGAFITALLVIRIVKWVLNR